MPKGRRNNGIKNKQKCKDTSYRREIWGHDTMQIKPITRTERGEQTVEDKLEVLRFKINEIIDYLNNDVGC